jgi:hypothetical protein
VTAKRPRVHDDTIAAKLRNATDLQLLSPYNFKSPLGEARGYLTAMLYLAPHTEAGGKSLCPHSTEACREGCLFTAGRGKTPRVYNARVRRSKLLLDDRPAFLRALVSDLEIMQAAAAKHRLKLAIRLNGTSDVLWERDRLHGASLFELFPEATFYDYTRTPLMHRHVPPNWRLVFSLADAPLQEAVEHLAKGISVAAVVPLEEKPAPGAFLFGREREVAIIDGDEDDLRFLDPPGALVLLKPKGRLLRGGPMVRPGLVRQLGRML